MASGAQVLGGGSGFRQTRVKWYSSIQCIGTCTREEIARSRAPCGNGRCRSQAARVVVWRAANVLLLSSFINMSSHASGPGPSLPTAQTPPAVANWNDVLALHLPLDPTVPPSRAFTNVNDSTHGYSARQPAPSSVPLPNTLTHDSDLVPRITTALQTGIQQLSTVPFPTATFEDALAEISETMSGIGRESIVSDTFMLVKSYLQKTLRPIFAQHGYELVLALESPAHLSSQVGDRNLVVNTTPEDASHVIAVEYKTFRAFMKHCYKEELFRTRGSFDCRQPAEGALAMLVKVSKPLRKRLRF